MTESDCSRANPFEMTDANLKKTKMNNHKFLIHIAVLSAACIVLAGCESDATDGADHHVRPSATQVPPASPTSLSSPTIGSANADPHGFQQ